MTRRLAPTLVALPLLPLLGLLAGCPGSETPWSPDGQGDGGFPNGSGGDDDDATGDDDDATGDDDDATGDDDDATGDDDDAIPGLSIDPANLGPDGCPTATLDPSAWGPLYTGYQGGSDPFFHLHTNEPVLFFAAELYTQWGAGWTGQTGTFAPDCNGNGICVYFVAEEGQVTMATAGEVDVVSLSQSNGAIQGPVEVGFRDMTFRGINGSQACYHVEEITLAVQ